MGNSRHFVSIVLLFGFILFCFHLFSSFFFRRPFITVTAIFRLFHSGSFLFRKIVVYTRSGLSYAAPDLSLIKNMPCPTKAEEEAVERYIRAVSRKWWWDNNHKPMFYLAKAINRQTTDSTSWKTRLNDTREFYSGSTNHNPIIVQTKAELAHSKRVSGQSAVSSNYSGPVAWTDKVYDLIVPERNAADPKLDGLPWGMNTSRKRRIRRDFVYPENIYHHHAKDGYVYWPRCDE